MSARPRIEMYFLILCAVGISCGTAAQPKTDTESQPVARNAGTKKFSEEEATERKAQEKVAEEKKAAREKAAGEMKAAPEKAAADSYVKIKVEVELRGVLTYTEKAATISIDKIHKWELDFGEDNET